MAKHMQVLFIIITSSALLAWFVLSCTPKQQQQDSPAYNAQPATPLQSMSPGVHSDTLIMFNIREPLTAILQCGSISLGALAPGDWEVVRT